MSMSLYALCLHPPLTSFSKKLAALKIGKKDQRTAAVAYADDTCLCKELKSNAENTVCELNIISPKYGTLHKYSHHQMI